MCGSRTPPEIGRRHQPGLITLGCLAGASEGINIGWLHDIPMRFNRMTYESTRWRFGVGLSGNMHAITLASAEIKPIDPVVFYDPNEPSRSCLVVGIDETTLAIAIIASVVGVTALVTGIR